MDSLDIDDHSGSHLLSLEPPDFESEASQSRTGHGGEDLSLSELSLDPDSILNKPFSLLARVNKPNPPSPPPVPVTKPVFSNPSVVEDPITPTKPLRLGKPLGRVFVPEEQQDEDDEDEDGDRKSLEEENSKPVEEDPEVARKQAQELRDEKLKSDLFVLKKLNSSFELFHEALSETGSANDVLLTLFSCSRHLTLYCREWRRKSRRQTVS